MGGLSTVLLTIYSGSVLHVGGSPRGSEDDQRESAQVFTERVTRNATRPEEEEDGKKVPHGQILW